MKRSFASTPARRVALMCVAAFVLYGGWACGVNVRHGWDTARAAGLAQGVSSTVSTVIISSLIELCLKAFGGRRGGWALAWLLPPTLTAGMHAAFQWAVGTPQILLTVLFSVLMGYVFAGVYVRGVLRTLHGGGPTAGNG